MDKTTTNTRNKGWEPKDGDVCFISAKYNHLIIFRKFENDVVKSYVNMTSHEDERSDSRMSNGVCYVNDIVEFRPATDWERMYFFDCMAKKGKMWDVENRKVVDYPMWDKKGDVLMDLQYMKKVRINKDDLNFLVYEIRYGILPWHTDCDAIIAAITDLFSVEDVNLSNTENIGKKLEGAEEGRRGASDYIQTIKAEWEE